MAEEKTLIACASGTGRYIDSHFGTARRFYIFELKDDDWILKEVRNVTPACDGGGHDSSKVIENFKLLSDCQYVIVARIGPGALPIAQQYGITVYEIPGDIDEAIDKVVKFIKVDNLFN